MRRAIVTILMFLALLGVSQPAFAACDWVIVGWYWNEETQQEEPIWEWQCWEDPPEWRNLNIISYDYRTGAGLCGSSVEISIDFGNGWQRTTDCSGFSNFSVHRYSTINYSVHANGYYTHGGQVYIDGDVTAYAPMDRIWHNLNFIVRNSAGNPICGALVHITIDFGNGTDRTTGCDGSVNFGVTSGSIGYTISASGYSTVNGGVTVNDHVTVSPTLATYYAGRYKLNTTGCYWEPNDNGPNQCSPNIGRYKMASTGCYWEASESGPNQCMAGQMPPTLNAPNCAGAPSLGISGSQFTVNGVPKFLLFVSYFDAMRRSNADGNNQGDLDTDFQYIRAKGFDGIRILPNWFHYDTGQPANDDALFTDSDVIRDEKWPVFLRVLERASAHGLLVDVTFTRETVSSLTVSEYSTQIRKATEMLRNTCPNVLIDIQNEFPINNRLTIPEAQAVISNYVRPADPQRIVMASTDAGSTPNFVTAGQIVAQVGMDVAAYHDPRDPNSWFTDAGVNDVVSGLKSGMGASQRPVYLQEPMPVATLCPPACANIYDPTLFHARSAASAAKRFGAAAWTFHTRSSFHLSSTTFKAVLDSNSDQKTEFEAVRPWTWRLVPNQTWKSGNGQFSLTYQSDGNLVLKNQSQTPVWASGRSLSDPLVATYQSDGNFVLWRGNGQAYWVTNTWGTPHGSLVVENDGTLGIYTEGGAKVWSTGAGGTGRLNGTSIIFPEQAATSNDGRFRLIYHLSGNLVLYRQDGSPIWESGTGSGNPGYVTMQSDGNFVITSGSGAAVWTTNTLGNTGAYLQLENNGNMAIFSASGSMLWTTGTGVY